MADPRSRVVEDEKKKIEAFEARKRAELYRSRANGAVPAEELSQQEIITYIAGAMAVILVTGLFCVWAVLKFFPE